MDQPGIPQLPEAVRASFESIMKVVSQVRQQLAGVKDVVTIRPGYKYPPDGKPVPAIVVAVTPGTRRCRPTELEAKFAVPFTVIDATVEEQLAADSRQPVSFGMPDGSMVSAFEKMLGGDEPLAFRRPRPGPMRSPSRRTFRSSKRRWRSRSASARRPAGAELETFLAETKKTLTVAMYQFTAPQFSRRSRRPSRRSGRKFELILHPVPEKPAKSGVKANDLDEEEEVIASARKENEDTVRSNLGHAGLEGQSGRPVSRPPITSRSRCGTATPSGSPAATGSRPTSRTFIRSSTIRKSCRRSSRGNTIATITPSSSNKKLAAIYEFYIKRDFELSAAQAEAVSFAAARSVRAGGGGGGAGRLRRAAAAVQAADGRTARSASSPCSRRTTTRSTCCR